MFFVPSEERDHMGVGRGQLGLGKFRLCFGDDNRRHRAAGIGRAIEHGERLCDVENTRHIFGALKITTHPVEVGGNAAQHDYLPSLA